MQKKWKENRSLSLSKQIKTRPGSVGDFTLLIWTLFTILVWVCENKTLNSLDPNKSLRIVHSETFQSRPTRQLSLLSDTMSKRNKDFKYFTINFESIVGLEVTRSHLTQNWKHVQEVVQRHVPLSVLWKDLSDPLAKRVILDRVDVNTDF